ncbi:sigma-70 family RNA polymerase sigma factor [Clostridium gasigenes]|uniref:sigma-70 family RNA polymerase sigma factor n=1 Tax=Clostridium gasigenes TaxID=94869 RepID=UPI0014383E85|nr:sigma-70 family RNA polymerase sigma factor [Clostridium gasigenes]NKF05662.1 sigma-70 family RNA polymerase sigma factor [Clostridium gasigenes]QSW19100.1 sigma-70 family RNA polymerase sigma factor [Clostridium gasigenes]
MQIEFNEYVANITPKAGKSIATSEFNELTRLLSNAQNGDEAAKKLLIKKYYCFIVSKTKGIYLNGYTFDALVQSGVETVLRSINAFNITKGIEAFTPYVLLSIKNNFHYLCRKEIRYNKVFSLNTIVKDNMASMDFIPDTKNLEEVVLQRITSKELFFSLKFLDKEELELIKFLYLDDDGEKQYLSNYAKLKGKDYYYCTSLKKRSLSKLHQGLS